MKALGAVVVGFLALALGCGGEDWVKLGSEEPGAQAPSGEGPGASGGEAPTRPAATTAGRQPGLEGVRQRGKLRVAADPNAPPFLAKGADGSFQGFEAGIIQAVAGRAGVPFEIVPATYDELPERLREGKADLIVGQLSPSSAIEGVSFSTSYLQYSMCLVVGASSPVKAIGDLKGKRVGMYEDPVARQVADTLIPGGYQRVDFQDYGYFEQLVRGQLDAVIYDCPLARYEITTFGDKLRVLDDALNVATYTVGVPQGDAQLLAEVNATLQELGNSGVLARLATQWLGEAAEARDQQTRSGRVVVVRRGDTLAEIAKRELGSVDRYKELYELNRDVVGPDPNLIYVGMKLRLPGA